MTAFWPGSFSAASALRWWDATWTDSFPAGTFSRGTTSTSRSTARFSASAGRRRAPSPPNAVPPAREDRPASERVPTGYLRLADPSTPGRHRTVYSLFPVIHEHYSGDDMPVEVVLELFGPLVVPEKPDAPPRAASPVWHATITVINRAPGPVAVDTTCFWPNLLGWRTARITAVDQPARSWPGQTHAGNTANAMRDTRPDGTSVVAAVQQRTPGRPVQEEMEGEVAVYSPGDGDDRVSVAACLKAGTTKIDRAPADQGHTVAWAEEHFRRTGMLPETGATWRAHWDEALASAVHRGFDLAPGAARSVTYTLAFDMPVVTFGEGRHWYRRYTSAWGTTGTNALEIAADAATAADATREEIDRWHATVLDGSRTVAPRPTATRASAAPQQPHPSFPANVRGAMINELYFINGGGSVWVDRWAHELDDHLPEPLLGAGEHAAILEGYDVGYYYYNTTDLWPYAWYAVARWWPRFAALVFTDLLQTIPLELPEERIFYRSEQRGRMLAAGKLPHDVGAVMEDPWHRLNGYQMRDDSNLWKDHNPGFIITFYLYVRERGTAITAEEWDTIRTAGQFLLAQDAHADGLLVHDEFGDSTWDNLGIRGHAAYSGGMTLAALAALTVWAREHDEEDLARECDTRLRRGSVGFVSHLWNGEYFRLCDEGRYTESLMADALIGLYFADLAGLGHLIVDRDDGGDNGDGIRRRQIVAHLQAVVRYNLEQYHHGRVGPLLVAAPGVIAFAGDGGDELQVNEVLLGSAWMTVAMLTHYGLREEAHRIAGALRETVYNTDGNGRGLQFRTPAAIDGAGRFRAPMNMRPLAIWFLDYATDTTHHDHNTKRL
jgi:non-lysosomal glucosylceramidase